jgi:lysophospholipase L1-like esterase
MGNPEGAGAKECDHALPVPGAVGKKNEARRMNSPFLPQALIGLLFATPLFAQGPPLFRADWGQGFASADLGHYPATGSGGGASCVSPVANPYPNPKLTSGPFTNCTIGSSLSVNSPFQGQLIDSFLNGQGIKPSESGVNIATVTRGNIVATATVSSFNDSSMVFAPFAGTNSYYYQEDLPSGVSPGGTLSLKFHIQGSAAKFGSLSVFFSLVSDDPSQQVGLGAPILVGGLNPGTVNLEVDTPPLVIGPSGTYSIFITVTAIQSGVGTSTVQVSTATYVALGDSFAAGDGDKPYGSGPGDQDCRRSAQGVPIRLNQPLGLIFVACTGAAIATLSASGPTPAQPTAQLDNLDSSTSLVTVMIGGNDALLFPSTIFCLVGPVLAFAGAAPGYQSGVPCANQHIKPGDGGIANGLTAVLATLHAPLAGLYQTIRARAPNARVLVLTYPNPFASLGDDAPICAGTGGLLSSADEKFLWKAIDSVNQVIVSAASGIAEVVDLNRDANSQFPFHGVCRQNNNWFLTPAQAPLDLTATLHPDSSGEAEMTRIVLAKLAGGAPSGTGFNVGPSQNVSTQANVSAGQGTALFSSSWPGSDIVMSLVSPSGRVFNRTTISPDLEHEAGSTFEVYRIVAPEAGTWTVNFFGANVAPSGEQLNFRFAVVPRAPGDADGDGVATCTDLAIVKASFGKRAGQPGFDRRADLNGDGVVDIRDLSAVAQQLLSGTTCH